MDHTYLVAQAMWDEDEARVESHTVVTFERASQWHREQYQRRAACAIRTIDALRAAEKGE